jgi:hypothetical protein
MGIFTMRPLISLAIFPLILLLLGYSPAPTVLIDCVPNSVCLLPISHPRVARFRDPHSVDFQISCRERQGQRMQSPSLFLATREQYKPLLWNPEVYSPSASHISHSCITVPFVLLPEKFCYMHIV